MFVSIRYNLGDNTHDTLTALTNDTFSLLTMTLFLNVLFNSKTLHKQVSMMSLATDNVNMRWYGDAERERKRDMSLQQDHIDLLQQHQS